ncbi:hypothetical protein Q8A67_015658 [Cirrhinus molitorella]|uniref:Uncharacterized protein n=1 Tax=Cirrhinus molitorella TaxID=172907 RepID=A0AA88PK99_9TELE|nr:hypothetical protein Q8A67_015658 [Cirrhinus molitorella]
MRGSVGNKSSGERFRVSRQMFVHRRTGEVWPFPKGQAGSGEQTRASPTGCRLFYIHAKGTDALTDASSRTPQSWAHLPGRKHQNEGHRCESDGDEATVLDRSQQEDKPIIFPLRRRPTSRSYFGIARPPLCGVEERRGEEVRERTQERNRQREGASRSTIDLC